MSREVNLINGQWVNGEGQGFSSTNPANNELLWQGEAASADQVNGAVNAAREAFYTWADTSFEQRLARRN